MTRLGACVAIGVSVSYAAITSAEIEPVVADGGSVITSKGYTFETEDLNEGASVRRSWVTLNDARCPLEIVEVALSTKGWRGDFSFKVDGSVKSSVPLSAFEVRFLLFDVFDQPLLSLSMTRVKDVNSDTEVPLSASWDARTSQVEELLTVVAYVAQVRTQEGAVWHYDETAVAHSVLELGLASDVASSADRIGGAE